MAEEEFVDVRPDWSGVSQVPVAPANVFLTSLGAPAGPQGVPDGVLLSIGYMRAPVLVGTPEENARDIKALNGKLPVAVSGNFTMSRERAVELMSLIETAVAQYDEQTQGMMHRA